MTRQPARFRSADVRRAVAAVLSCGIPISRVEVDGSTGKIAVSIGQPANGPETNNKSGDEWDEVLRDKH